MINPPAFLTTGRASCANPTYDPDMWWSSYTEDERQAVAICRAECPLRDACAQFALDNEEQQGTWGGLTRQDRLRLRRGAGWWIDDEGRIRRPCGTETSYATHCSYREEPCAACAAAHDVVVEERRRAVLLVEHAKGGTVIGYDTHWRLDEEACPACKAAKWAADPRNKTAAVRVAA